MWTGRSISHAPGSSICAMPTKPRLSVCDPTCRDPSGARAKGQQIVQKAISVCIPTCKRPDLLQLAVKSCLDQTVLPSEILIGDDSPDDSTRLIVEALAASSPVPIRYFHNSPALGQAAN